MKIIKEFKDINNKKHRIVKYANKKYYNHYDVIDNADYNSVAGAFQTIAGAYSSLKKHRIIKREKEF